MHGADHSFLSFSRAQADSAEKNRQQVEQLEDRMRELQTHKVWEVGIYHYSRMLSLYRGEK